MKELEFNVFENIKHIDGEGNEYWSARELQKVFDYKKWQNFNKVIEQAKTSCKESKNNTSEQFTEVSKPIICCNNNIQNAIDYHLSRYACYLIAQNGDPRKKVIALAQTYFVVQTRKQELLEQNYNNLSENKK